MDKQEVAKLRNLFDSIVCLAAEGPELHPKLDLMEAIIEEATKGYDICACHLTSQCSRPDYAEANRKRFLNDATAAAYKKWLKSGG